MLFRSLWLSQPVFLHCEPKKLKTYYTQSVLYARRLASKYPLSEKNVFSSIFDLGVTNITPYTETEKCLRTDKAYYEIDNASIHWNDDFPLKFLLAGYTPMRAALIGIGLAWFVAFFNFRPDSSPSEKRSACVAAAISAALAALLALCPELTERVNANLLFVLICAFLLVASRFNPGMNVRDSLDRKSVV